MSDLSIIRTGECYFLRSFEVIFFFFFGTWNKFISDFLLALSPFKMDLMPDDLREEYTRDLMREVEEREIVFNKNHGDEGNYSILSRYSVCIAYVKKAPVNWSHRNIETRINKSSEVSQWNTTIIDLSDLTYEQRMQDFRCRWIV